MNVELSWMELLKAYLRQWWSTDKTKTVSSVNPISPALSLPFEPTQPSCHKWY